MMRRSRRALGIAALALWAGAAQAQDTAAANALFNKGVADLEAGRYAQACPALEESYRLDPTPGTLFTLAECEAKWGRVATALARYKDYLGLMSRLEGEAHKRHEERAEAARAAIAGLEPKVPTLALVLPQGAPSGTTVKRDGVELKGASLGTALPVDPGEHVVTVQAPGGGQTRLEVRVALGEHKRVELEVELPQAPAPAPAPAVAAEAPPAAAPTDTPPAEPPDRTLVWLLGGVGAAGVVVGGVTGAMVFGKRATVRDECTGAACTAAGKEAADSGKSLGMVSNVGIGVGAAGLLAAVVLLATEPTPQPQEHARGWKPVVEAGGHGAWLGARAAW